jgi:hypothetical protein
VRITDDNGRLKKFFKKSEWTQPNLSLRIRREIFLRIFFRLIQLF